MSLKIIRAGLLDTVQDAGRYGHQHLGINPGGAMDRFSASLANALLGKDISEAVLELHFPASQILFNAPCVICLAGADFSPAVNGVPVPLHQPLAIAANAVLSFERRRSGARCYLSLLNGWNVEKWLGSGGTNLKVGIGGYQGRKLLRGDEVDHPSIPFRFIPNDGFQALHWRYPRPDDGRRPVQFIPGPEWDWLTTESQTRFLNTPLTITPSSDRMGYRLQGEALEQATDGQMVSSAVCFGTIQLLPNGQTIVLMADHQTTGGYPRIGHAITAHLPRLAQMSAGTEFRFEATTVEEAEAKLVMQQRHLGQLQAACNLKMKNWLQGN